MRPLFYLIERAMWIFTAYMAIWNIVIGFQNGFLSGIITFFLPVVSSFYWMIKMWGSTFSTLTLWAFIVAGIVKLLTKASRI